MTDPLRLTLQESLGSAFTLKAELGGGGMSRVFVAREEALGRDVVVKVLAPELAEGLSVERFAREIRLAAALQEPHIVPVLTAGVTTLGTPYYTMPFVRGASLRERMTQGPIPPAEAFQLLRDVAQALAYAHAQGVVHRDIKPENILLSSGTAVVTDFGIAKALRASRTEDADGVHRAGITRTGMSLGTPAYMSPEQAAGDPDTDQRADLYAWGVVAYEMLAGRHPFARCTSPQQLLTAHMVEMPMPLATSAGVSPTLLALVMQCLAKDATDRPTSASAIVAQLSGAAPEAGGMSESSKASVVAEPRAWRTPIIGAATLLALIAVAVWWRGSTRDASSAPSTAAASGPVMMAVLPFEHAGPADQQPFTDGLTDAVTAKLGGLSSLMVIDRRSAATYRGTTKSTQQIGTELGVRYLLEGVVRWAKDGAGVWRARVTPTLVDAKSGAIKWTGEPATVTLEDPFTAQGSIATDVAAAMEVVVLPKERVELKRRFTDNPQAYAAYQRARLVISDAIKSTGTISQDARERAVREIDRAIALDSNFSAAWGILAMNRLGLALMSGESNTLVRARTIIATARLRAPNEPFALIAAADVARGIDRDSLQARELVSRAIALAPNDATVLNFVSDDFLRDAPDSAYALAAKSITLDPFSSINLVNAAWIAIATRRFRSATQYADRLIALDSSGEGGWSIQVAVGGYTGDTLALKTSYEKLLRHVPQLSGNTFGFLPYSGANSSRWLLDAPRARFRLTSRLDSVRYYDTKIDAALILREFPLAKSFADSIIALSGGINTTHFERDILANALALVGASTQAQRELERSAATRYRDMRAIASTYATLGMPAQAAEWIERSLRDSYTLRWYDIDPRMRAFRTTAEWKRLVATHPVRDER